METWELRAWVDELFERYDALTHQALGRLAALASGTTPPSTTDSLPAAAQQQEYGVE